MNRWAIINRPSRDEKAWRLETDLHTACCMLRAPKQFSRACRRLVRRQPTTETHGRTPRESLSPKRQDRHEYVDQKRVRSCTRRVTFHDRSLDSSKQIVVPLEISLWPAERHDSRPAISCARSNPNYSRAIYCGAVSRAPASSKNAMSLLTYSPICCAAMSSFSSLSPRLTSPRDELRE